MTDMWMGHFYPSMSYIFHFDHRWRIPNRTLTKQIIELRMICEKWIHLEPLFEFSVCHESLMNPHFSTANQSSNLFHTSHLQFVHRCMFSNFHIFDLIETRFTMSEYLLSSDLHLKLSLDSYFFSHHSVRFSCAFSILKFFCSWFIWLDYLPTLVIGIPSHLISNLSWEED